MILQGSRVDARDYHGDTPIFQACSRGATRNVELLLEKGAAIDVANDLDERVIFVVVVVYFQFFFSGLVHINYYFVLFFCSF